jgi:hypothetical protein
MDAEQINKYTAHSPHLVCLSLFYDGKVDFMQVRHSLTQLDKPLKRLEIHCDGAFCSHLQQSSPQPSAAPNVDVKYLLIELGYFLLPSRDQCHRRRQSCFLITMRDFISTMFNVGHLRLMTERDNLDQILDWNGWTSLIKKRPHLRKITVQTSRYTLCGKRYVEKAIEIYAAAHRAKKTLH